MTAFCISLDVLKAAAMHCSTTKDARYYLHGINIRHRGSDKAVTVSATNGNTLFVAVLDIENRVDNFDFTFNVSPDFLKKLEKSARSVVFELSSFTMEKEASSGIKVSQCSREQNKEVCSFFHNTDAAEGYLNFPVPARCEIEHGKRFSALRINVLFPHFDKETSKTPLACAQDTQAQYRIDLIDKLAKTQTALNKGADNFFLIRQSKNDVAVCSFVKEYENGEAVIFKNMFAAIMPLRQSDVEFDNIREEALAFQKTLTRLWA